MPSGDNHYLNQCWPRCPTPYVVSRPRWLHNRNPHNTAKWMSLHIVVRRYCHSDGEYYFKEIVEENKQSSVIEMLLRIYSLKTNVSSISGYMWNPSNTPPTSIFNWHTHKKNIHWQCHDKMSPIYNSWRKALTTTSGQVIKPRTNIDCRTSYCYRVHQNNDLLYMCPHT